MQHRQTNKVAPLSCNAKIGLRYETSPSGQQVSTKFKKDENLISLTLDKAMSKENSQSNYLNQFSVNNELS